MQNQEIIFDDIKFQTLPIWKLVVLSIFTFGFYEIVWFYNIWKALAQCLPYKISPFWRMFFAGITNFSLFPKIAIYIEKHNKKAFPPILFAILYLAIEYLYKLQNPYWLLSYCSILVIIIIQKQINNINTEFYSNAQYNNWNLKNTLWSVFGGLFIILAILVIFIKD